MRKIICATVVIFFLYAGNAWAETLRIVTSLDSLEAVGYINEFKKDTGIDVDWIRLSAGEVLARLKSEAKNPTQDVWFGAPIIEFIAAKDADILAPHISENTRVIPEEWRDKDGFWTGIYFGAIVFISDPKIEPPRSWLELLEPRYSGEIVVSYPYTAGTGYTMLAGLIAIMGEEEALDYYKKLDQQVRRYTQSGGAPIIEVSLGEAGVGIVFDQDALRKGKSRGFKFSTTYPSDGVPYEIGGVAAIKGGKTGLAARFIDWITSLPGQNLMQKWYRVPLHPKAGLNPESIPPDKINLAPIDFQSAGKKRMELIKKWREKAGK